MAKRGRVPQAARPKPAKPLKRRISFFFQALIHLRPEDLKNALLLMAMPEPARAQMRSALEAEMKMVVQENAFAYHCLIAPIIEAHEEGRVLFGWSSYRAKAAQRAPISWEEWDAFCSKWIGEVSPSPSRPAVYSDEALAAEVLALESRGLVIIEGGVPGDSPKKKRATA